MQLLIMPGIACVVCIAATSREVWAGRLRPAWHGHADLAHDLPTGLSSYAARRCSNMRACRLFDASTPALPDAPATPAHACRCYAPVHLE